MVSKIWASVVKFLNSFWILLLPLFKPFMRLIGVAVILTSAWYAFLSLVSKPPIDPTPVLIMIWSSVLVFLLALFPRILRRIKRFKVKDFEIELQESVLKSTPDEYISLADFDNQIFSQKGDFESLSSLLDQAVRDPSKPVLLVANLKDGQYISVPMLFIYLFFLDLIGRSITVLFVSTPYQLRQLSDISQRSVIGAISGKKLLKYFYNQRPYFVKLLSRLEIPNVPFEEFFARGHFPTMPEVYFGGLYRGLMQFRDSEREREFLTRGDVLAWYKDDLSVRSFDISLKPTDIKTIQAAISLSDDYVISVNNGLLVSVVSTHSFARSLSRRVLANTEFTGE
jgi:hypothetical protein